MTPFVYLFIYYWAPKLILYLGYCEYCHDKYGYKYFCCILTLTLQGINPEKI